MGTTRIQHNRSDIDEATDQHIEDGNSNNENNPDDISTANIKVTTTDLFWLRWPGLFFFMVEFAFLLQSFYLAIYVTQLLPVAISTNSPGWGIALIIMPMIMSFLLYLTLNTASIVYTTTKLNRMISGRVVEEAATQLTIAKDIRAKVNEYFEAVSSVENARTYVDADGFTKYKRKDGVSIHAEKFEFIRKHLDPDGSEDIDRMELREFFGE